MNERRDVGVLSLTMATLSVFLVLMFLGRLAHDLVHFGDTIQQGPTTGGQP